MLLISEWERGYVLGTYFLRPPGPLLVAYYISFITNACMGMDPCIWNQQTGGKIRRLRDSTRTGLGLLAYSLIDGVSVRSKRPSPHSSRLAKASFLCAVEGLVVAIVDFHIWILW